MVSPLSDRAGNPHTFLTQNQTQQNPLLSLPSEILLEITDYVTTGDTPQEAAAHAVRWGLVAVLPHLMTHEPQIEGVIHRAKDLDEALVAMWNHCIASKLDGVPRIATAREIRGWMADPNNTPFLDAIKEVALSNRGLRVIPPEINHLRNLHTLDLDYNQITRVDPQAFIGCPALEYLFLDYNQITQIACRAFVGCGALKRLNLANNRIVQIASQTFASCGTLNMLCLQRNQIAQIDAEAFVGCKALHTLFLEYNQIAHIAPQAFVGCEILHMLRLQHNKIVQIACLAFAGCPALHTLRLQHNQIVQLEPQAFVGCQNLQWLHLSRNQIAQLEPKIFADCPILRTLDLRRNQITQIDPQIFVSCPALRTLDLRYNAVLCELSSDKENALKRFKAFSRYVCRSEVAAFYKAVSEGRIQMSAVSEQLQLLEDRNLIHEMVCLEAKEAAERVGEAFSDDEDPQQEEHLAYDDKMVFCLALKRAVKEKFNRLRAEQKCAVHDAIYRIAQEDGAPSPPPPPAKGSPTSWGEEHREENVLRFLDAMAGI